MQLSRFARLLTYKLSNENKLINPGENYSEMILMIFFINVVISKADEYKLIKDFPLTNNCIIWTKYSQFRSMEKKEIIKIAYVQSQGLEIQLLIDVTQYKHLLKYQEIMIEYNFSSIIYEGQWIINYLGLNLENNLFMFSSLASNGVIQQQQIMVTTISLYMVDEIDTIQLNIQFLDEIHKIENFQQLETIVQDDYCTSRQSKNQIQNNSQLILENQYSISFWFYYSIKSEKFSLINFYKEDVSLEVTLDQVEFSVKTYNITRNNQYSQINYKFTIEEELQNKWVYFTLNFYKKLMILMIFPYKSKIIFENLNQYSYSNMVSSIGDKVELITIKSCISQIYEQKECQGCQYCVGPYIEQCEKCDEKQYYHSIDKVCYCKFGFIEQNGICLEFNQIFNYTETETHDLLVEECPVGQFLDDNLCIECPNDNNQGFINCGDCYLNPLLFRDKGQCTIDLIKYDEFSDFQTVERHPNNFQIYFNQLRQLDNQYSVCTLEAQCFFVNIQRFIMKVQCKSNYVRVNDQCMKCTENCKRCSQYVGKCIQCEDNYFLYQNQCYEQQQNCLVINDGSQCEKCKKGYFVNQNSKCEECPIECQFCFQQDFYGQRLIICEDNRQSNNYLDSSYQEVKNCNIYLNLMMNDVYQILNLTQPVSICGQCQQGYINGLIECKQSLNQTQQIKYNEEEFELIKLQENVEIQFCISYFLIENNIQYCLECQDGYYQDRYFGYCLKCMNCKNCVQLNDQLSPNIVQLYYQYFNLPIINFINQKHSYVDCIECSVDQELYNGLCINKCPSYCKRCQIIDNENICVECIKDEHESFIIQNNQCYKCELGCEICLVRAKIDINIYNTYYKQKNDSYTNCIRYKNATKLDIQQNLIFDINVYCDHQEYINRKDNVSLFIEDVFSKDKYSYFGKMESEEIINFFDQIKVKTITLNLNIIPNQNGLCFINNTNFIPQIQKHIYTLQYLNVVLYSQQNCTLVIAHNLQFYDISFLLIKGFNIQINNNIISIFRLYNLQFYNITFYQLRNDTEFMIFASCPSIKFYNIVLKNLVMSNIFIRIIDRIVGLDFNKIYIIDCHFVNFLFLQYYYAKRVFFIESHIKAKFINSSLVQQNTYNWGNQNFSIEDVKFFIQSTDSIILNLNQNDSYTFIDKVLVNNSVFHNSFFLKAQNLQVYYFFCMQNTLIQSQIINIYKQKNHTTIVSSKWLLEIMIFRSNQLDYLSELISIYNEMQQDELIFNIFYLEFNTLVGPNTEHNSLVNINYMRTLINNATFRRTGGITEINIIFSVTIQIFNVTVYQLTQCRGSECYNSVFKMLGMNLILMRSCNFYNLTALNTVIEIVGKLESFIPREQFSIEISHTIFQNIFIQNLNQQANLISITNLINYLIVFFKLHIENIVAINYQKETFGLIYIESEYSNIQITSLKCFNNFISNASLFYLNAQNVEIKNSSFSFLNQNYGSIKKFIQNQQVYFEHFNQLINQKGGFMHIDAKVIVIDWSYFTDAVATQGGALSINNFNSLEIKNSDFSHLNTEYNDFDVNLGGAIFLESKFQTQILISFTFFIECSSLQGGAIYTSLKNKATILIDTVVQIDNYALIGSFLKTNFNHETVNKITIKSIDISYTFNDKIHNKISLEQYASQLNKNQIFNLDNCYVFISYAYYEGQIGLGILYGQNISLHILKLSIMGITNLISTMIYVQNLQYAKIIEMINYDIKTLNVIQACTQYYLILPKIDFRFSLETLDNSILKSFYNQSYYENILQCNYNILQEAVKNFPLILLQGQQNRISFKKVIVQQINFSNSQQKIMILQGNSILIKQLYMFQNNCGFNGCFYLKQSNLTRRLLQAKINICNIFDSLIYENVAEGGDFIYVDTSQVILQNVVFYKNVINQNIGSIIRITQSQSTQFRQLKLSDNIQSNGAQFKFDQSMIPSLYLTEVYSKQQIYMISQAAGFTVSFRNQLLSKILIKQIEIIKYYELLIKDYSLPNGDKTNDNTIYLPCGQSLKQYKYFSLDRTQINLNLTLNIQFLNILNELTQQENQIYCQIQIENQSFYYINQTNQFSFDDLIIYNDPYRNQTIQGQITCPPLTQILYMNIKTFKCQIGEQFINNSCIPCDDQRQSYNSLPGQKCKLANTDQIKDVLNNQLMLKQGYWRPNYEDRIEFCINNPQNCKGGLEIGDKSCQHGYVGVLCELCDIYNIQGFGAYGYNGNFKCTKCDFYQQIIHINIIISMSIWIVIINKYLIARIQDNIYWAQRLLQLNKKGIKTQKQLNQTYLLKLLLIQIFTFHIYQMTNIYQYRWFNIIALLGNPFYTIELHLDCFHQYLSFQNEALNKILIKLCIPILFQIILIISFGKQLIQIIKLFIYEQYVNFLMLLIITIQTKEASGMDFMAFASIQYQSFIPFKYIIIYPIILIIVIIPILLYFRLRNGNNQQEWIFLYLDYKGQYHYWEFINLLKQFLILMIFMFNLSRNLIYFSGLAIYLIYRKVLQHYQPIKDILHRKIKDTILYNQAILIIILLILNQTNLVFIEYAVFWLYIYNILLMLHHILYQQSLIYKDKIIRLTLSKYIPKLERGKQSQQKLVNIIRRKVIQQQFGQNSDKKINNSYVEFELVTLKTDDH